MTGTVRTSVWGSIRKLGLAALIGSVSVIGPVVGIGSAQARGPAVAEATVSLGELPGEAQAVSQRITTGGPFAYAKDGTVFGNRERLLPRRERGFYREYTVTTPRARNRGARRIVCGGVQPTNPDACYYTDDHYASFRRIVK